MYLRWKAQICNKIGNGPRSSEIGHVERLTEIRYREYSSYWALVEIMKGKYQNVDMRYEIMEIYEMSRS